MSSIIKRETAKGVVWRARYYDQDGKQHCRHFPRKSDARTWLDQATAALATGRHVDPRAGKITFRAYAEEWRTRQIHRPSSAAKVENDLRLHAYPAFGDLPIADIKASRIQSWVKALSATLAPSTVRTAHGIVAGVFNDAVADRVIASTPCDRTTLPEIQPRRLVIPTEAQVAALHTAMTGPYRALVHLGAAAGLRQAELFGLTVDRVDFLRREVTVDRQLSRAPGDAPVFGPPKTRKSHRVIPVPADLVEALSLHVAEHGTGPEGLLFTSRYGGALKVSTFNAGAWSKAVIEAGCPAGMTVHWLRHYYASRLIRYGESVKTVQARLGHATAAETLDTYGHLWPDSDDRTREAAAGAVAGALRDGQGLAAGS
jgi:integrase